MMDRALAGVLTSTLNRVRNGLNGEIDGLFGLIERMEADEPGPQEDAPDEVRAGTAEEAARLLRRVADKMGQAKMGRSGFWLNPESFLGKAILNFLRRPMQTDSDPEKPEPINQAGIAEKLGSSCVVFQREGESSNDFYRRAGKLFDDAAKANRGRIECRDPEPLPFVDAAPAKVAGHNWEASKILLATMKMKGRPNKVSDVGFTLPVELVDIAANEIKGPPVPSGFEPDLVRVAPVKTGAPAEGTGGTIRLEGDGWIVTVTKDGTITARR